MSTKSTIILTNDDEHIYYEGIDMSYVMEFNKKNIDILINDEDDLVISINEDSDLYNQLHKLFVQNIGK